MGATAPSFADGDDYPWAGQGQCPLVPLPPPPPVPQAPDKPGKPDQPGSSGQHPATPAHGKPANAAVPDPTVPATPPPPRVCAKNIWFINGSYADSWGFALRNCTSFVAWRLRETNGVSDFDNHMSGGHWGNAENWDENARALGYLVDHVPAIGAVAQTDDGRVGHVAWVSAIDGDTVTIEEYNHAGPGIYSTRTVPTSDFRYIHVGDVSPGPNRGSTRAPATAADEAGRSWTFQVDSSGDLVRREAGIKPRTLGAPGAWSTLAAPTTTVDDEGQVWLAAVGTDGRIRISHSTLRGGWTRLQPVDRVAAAPTSSPALVPDGRRGVRLLTVTDETGQLNLFRVRLGASAVSDHRVLPGSWSPYSSPAVALDEQHRTWVGAVTMDGQVLVRHRTREGWTPLRKLGRADRLTSPSLAPRANGRVLLAATDGGRTTVRPADSTARQVGARLSKLRAIPST